MAKKMDGEASGCVIKVTAKEPVQVTYATKVTKVVRKRTGPRLRRVPPRVAEGPDRPTFSMSLSARAFDAAAVAPSPGDNIAIVQDTELLEPTRASLAGVVGEPSLASNGSTMLLTGNWYAGISTDGGKKFKMANPFEDFKRPGDAGGFCCDQIAHYIPKIDTFVWLLQYDSASGVNNVQRLVFAKSADAAAGRWKVFDIDNAVLGLRDKFLDYPDLALGENHLYMTTNFFAAGSRFTEGAALLRIPFDSIDSARIQATRFITRSSNSLRVAQNCGKTAFFATHDNTSTLRVFSWPENRPRPTSKTVPVARFIDSGFQSRTPDDRRWLDRSDTRLTAGTKAGDELWFAWNVGRDSNRRPRPFIQIARINAKTMANIEDINVFDEESATAYASLTTNAAGEVGIAYWTGGGPRFPTFTVGILTGNRRDKLVVASDRGPAADENNEHHWGDYCAVRPLAPGSKLFAASGYVLKGKRDGRIPTQSGTPHVVVFGRQRDV